MTDKLKQVEKMISDIMKDRELSRAATIDYMLGVATGRLLALGRYTGTLPKGKATKGILQLAGKKKRAPKSAKISTLAAAEDKPAKAKKPAKSAKKRKPAKKRKASKVAEIESVEVSADE